MTETLSKRASLFGLGLLLVALRAWLLIAHASFGGRAVSAEDLIVDLHRQVFSLTEANVELARRLQMITEEHHDLQHSCERCPVQPPVHPGDDCPTETRDCRREAPGDATLISAPKSEPAMPPCGEGGGDECASLGGSALQRVHDLLWAEIEAGRAALRQAYELLRVEWITHDASSAVLTDIHGLLMMRFAGACSTLREAYGLLADDRVRSSVVARARAVGESVREPYGAIAAQLKSEATVQETFEVLSAQLDSSDIQESRAVLSTVLGLVSLASLVVVWPSLAAVAQALAFLLDYRMLLLKLSVLVMLGSLLMFGGVSYAAFRYTRHAADHPV